MEGWRLARITGAVWLVAAVLNVTAAGGWTGWRYVLVAGYVIVGLAFLLRPSRQVIRLGFVWAAFVFYSFWDGITHQTIIDYGVAAPAVIGAFMTVIANALVPRASDLAPKEPPPELL